MDLGEFWNSVFAGLWIGAQLLFWLAVAFGAAILAFAVIVGCWRGAKSWFKPKPTVVRPYRQLLEDAEAEAADRNENRMYQMGFVDGAQWNYLHDK